MCPYILQYILHITFFSNCMQNYFLKMDYSKLILKRFPSASVSSEKIMRVELLHLRMAAGNVERSKAACWASDNLSAENLWQNWIASFFIFNFRWFLSLSAKPKKRGSQPVAEGRSHPENWIRLHGGQAILGDSATDQRQWQWARVIRWSVSFVFALLFADFLFKFWVGLVGLVYFF